MKNLSKWFYSLNKYIQLYFIIVIGLSFFLGSIALVTTAGIYLGLFGGLISTIVIVPLISTILIYFTE